MKKISKLEQTAYISSDYLVTELIDEVLEYFCYVRLYFYGAYSLDYNTQYEYQSELFNAIVNLYTYCKRFYENKEYDNKKDFLTNFWEKMFYNHIDTVKLITKAKLSQLCAIKGLEKNIINDKFEKIAKDWVFGRDKIIEIVCSGSILVIENFVTNTLRYGCVF